jgi:hypothetical protein
MTNGPLSGRPDLPGDSDMRRVLASMAMSELEQMPRVGYWRSPEEPDLSHPADYVDASWDPAERRNVIDYLDHAYQIPMFSCGPSWCLMGCADVPEDIGTEDLTVGAWQSLGSANSILEGQLKRVVQGDPLARYSQDHARPASIAVGPSRPAYEFVNEWPRPATNQIALRPAA